MLQKAQEVKSLSEEIARLLRQSFAKGNEITDLKEQCNERQAEIERLNEVRVLLCFSSLLINSTASGCLKTCIK